MPLAGHRTIPAFLIHLSSDRRPHVQLDPSAFLADPELLKALEKRATPFLCDEDRVLFRQGDLPTGLFVIHKGEATLSMNPGASENAFSCKTTAGSFSECPASSATSLTRSPPSPFAERKSALSPATTSTPSCNPINPSCS